MAGRTLAAVRRGQLKPGRHIAWMFRTAVCVGALSFRHSPDLVFYGAVALSAGAFAAGWRLAAHPRPPEDLSDQIVPPEEE